MGTARRQGHSLLQSSWIQGLGEAAETRFVPIVGVLLALGVLFRVLLIWTTTTPTDPLNHLYPGFTDGDEYMDNARSLLANGVYGYGGRISAFRPPAYPFLIALAWRVFGQSLTPVRLVHTGLFVVMAILYIRVVAGPFGRLAGILAACFLSFYPLFAFMTTEIATESLYMALESAVFVLSLMVIDAGVPLGRRTGAAFMAGLCCGAGTLTRPNMYFVFLGVLALIPVVALWNRAGWRAWILPVVGLTIGTYAVVLPWMIRNERRLGAPVITTNLYYNFFRGTFDLVEGIPKDTTIFAIFRKYHVLYEQDIENPDTRELPVGEVENERLARSAALSIIQAAPGEWLWQRLRNALYLWLNLQWDRDIIHKSPLAWCAAAGVTGVYYLLLGGAMLGTYSVCRGRRDAGERVFVILAWIFVLMATPTALTFVGKRYRVAMIDPYLALVCCGALASWLRRRRGQRARASGTDPGMTPYSRLE